MKFQPSFLTPSLLKPSLLTQGCTVAMFLSTAVLLTACHSDSDNQPFQDNKPVQDGKSDNKKDGKTDKPVTDKPIKNSPLIGKAEVINTFSTEKLNQLVKGQTNITAKCDVKVKKLTYHTQGSAGELTKATSALMIPTGKGKDCSGKRPVLLYAHGTTVEQSYDLTQVGNSHKAGSGQADELAVNYASQGYVVVAPNYAGYDKSTLNYHPYLNKKQQTIDMYNALKSARHAVQEEKELSFADKLFISGYSQGGFVALATAEYLQNQGETVTAVAPMSGPYAMLAFGDAIFSGQVNQGATIFAPLVATNYQKQYGDLYNSPSDVYNPKYANTAPTAMPSDMTVTELVDNNKIPYLPLFQSNTGNQMLEKLPKSAPFFFHDTDYLIKTEYRLNYLADTKENPDTLSSTGQTSKCGGNQDPMVFFDVNTSNIANIWRQKADLDITILDVDNTNAKDRNNMPTLQYIGKASKNKRNMDTIAKGVQKDFASEVNKTFKASGKLGMLMNYHSPLTHTACADATRQYFAQFR
ncbi:MAG: hypothetical protein CR966_01070 [Pseudomonadales bacterium]|nr:MAG: hypothetical protein CR966_01070 [Pseudomonadales bacterium]